MSATEIVIRPLQGPAEARACADMMARSEPWITLKRGFEFNLKLLNDSTRELYVATIGEAIAGFVILNLLGPLRGYVQTLGVMPDWRKQGIGAKLMAFAEERIFRECPMSSSAFPLSTRRRNAFMPCSDMNRSAS